VWYDALDVFFRRPTPRPISEAVAYARCYGERGSELLRVSKAAPPSPPRPSASEPKVSGEKLRRDFESRLASRL
jgi:hypothetical protein